MRALSSPTVRDDRGVLVGLLEAVLGLEVDFAQRQRGGELVERNVDGMRDLAVAVAILLSADVDEASVMLINERGHFLDVSMLDSAVNMRWGCDVCRKRGHFFSLFCVF
jgi:hypothetical protein